MNTIFECNKYHMFLIYSTPNVRRQKKKLDLHTSMSINRFKLCIDVFDDIILNLARIFVK